MGVAVFAGMIGATVFGLFLTPVFYVTLRALTGNRPLKAHTHPDESGHEGIDPAPSTATLNSHPEAH
ncbi:MAG: hypothetical protein LDL37_06240, partial [Asticcacaulis sp.]